MKNKDLLDFYEKQYFYEAHSRDAITGRCQITIAILVAVMSGYSIVAKTIFIPSLFFSQCFYGLFIAIGAGSFGFFIYSFINIKKAFFGNEYRLIADMRECQDYFDKCEELYIGKGYKDEKGLVSEAMRIFIRDSYIECATNNAKANDERSEYILKSNKFAIGAILPLALLLSINFYVLAQKEGNGIEIENHYDTNVLYSNSSDTEERNFNEQGKEKSIPTSTSAKSEK